MRNPRHVALAVAVVTIWGVNFVAIGLALEGFPPILLAALRFALTSLAAFFVPRPKVQWRWIAAVGLTTLAGQYGLLFLGMSKGMPEGLSALVIQAQVPFTILVAAVALRERTSVRQLSGIAVAAAGLVVIGVGRGGAVPLVALLLVLGAAVAWSVGNVCTRQAKADNGFALLVWASLFATPPLFGLSLVMEGPHRVAESLTHLQLAAVAGLLFVVLVSTLVGMGGWVVLLSKYPAHSVVPYALGVPPIGMVAGVLFHGEHASGVELVGSAVVLAGLVAIVGPARPKTSVPAAKVREAVST